MFFIKVKPYHLLTAILEMQVIYDKAIKTAYYVFNASNASVRFSWSRYAVFLFNRATIHLLHSKKNARVSFLSTPLMIYQLKKI